MRGSSLYVICNMFITINVTCNDMLWLPPLKMYFFVPWSLVSLTYLAQVTCKSVHTSTDKAIFRQWAFPIIETRGWVTRVSGCYHIYSKYYRTVEVAVLNILSSYIVFKTWIINETFHVPTTVSKRYINTHCMWSIFIEISRLLPKLNLHDSTIILLIIPSVSLSIHW